MERQTDRMQYISLFFFLFLISLTISTSPSFEDTKEKDGLYEGTNFYSLCTESKYREWIKNDGKVIQSWIKSIIPTTTTNNGGSFNHSLVYLRRDSHFFKINKIVSPGGLGWKVLGSENRNGWLYGPFNLQNQSFLYQTLTYIYPDFSTGLTGSFDENGEKLNYGTETKITRFRCKEGFLELEFSKFSKRKNSVYRFERGTDRIPSSVPLLRDPLERKQVYIASSKKYPEINGDSLYARRNIEANSIVAYYNGIYIPTDFHPVQYTNITKDEQDDIKKNFMHYNSTHRLDIPPSWTPITRYRATLAHKVNHAFLEKNVAFCPLVHPRFGQIIAIVSVVPIHAGEELLVNYGYGRPRAASPTWYAKMYNETYKDDVIGNGGCGCS